jgi:hypothetical protein
LFDEWCAAASAGIETPSPESPRTSAAFRAFMAETNRLGFQIGLKPPLTDLAPEKRTP